MTKCGCKIIDTRHARDCGCDEGCSTEQPSIVFCPLHAAAEEMLAELNKLHDFIQDGSYHHWKGLEDAEKLIAKASNARVNP